MTRPLLSVIIPLYNHAPFIERCLDSVLEDPYPDKEIVIIDDGSRDESAEIVRQWHARNSPALAERFTFITRENRGLTKTLNELVARARGELIALLASDDYLLPGGLTLRADYLERHFEKSAVFGDCLLVDYEGNLSDKSGLSDLHDGRKRHLSHPRLLPYEIVLNWCVPGPVFMARKELYARIGGYNENIAVEDWDFYLRVTAGGGLGFIDQPVAAYRVRPDGAADGFSVAQHIRYNEAMLETVKNNLSAYSGFKKAFLYFEGLKYRGVLDRLRGANPVRAFIARKTGRIMTTTLKGVYRLWADRIAPPAAEPE